jgi:predicted RecB family nuclease
VTEVQVRPLVNAIQASLLGQVALTSGDPAVDLAAGQLAEALGPALQVALTELAEQAAAEVRAQLPGHQVDVVLTDGDPTLRVVEAPPATPGAAAEDLDARITLRLTPTLKQLVEEAAQRTGDSVNAWVMETLGQRAGRDQKRGRGAPYTQSFDL